MIQLPINNIRKKKLQPLQQQSLQRVNETISNIQDREIKIQRESESKREKFFLTENENVYKLQNKKTVQMQKQYEQRVIKKKIN